MDQAVQLNAAQRRVSGKRSVNRETIVGCVLGTAVADALGADSSELIELLRQAISALNRGESTSNFARSLGLERGVSGYTSHTVPIVINAWLSYPKDYRKAVTTTIECGGDADTTAAIVGGIAGAGVRNDGIPADWHDGILEWPRSVRWMQQLGEMLADSLHGNKTAKSSRNSASRAPSQKSNMKLLNNQPTAYTSNAVS